MGGMVTSSFRMYLGLAAIVLATSAFSVDAGLPLVWHGNIEIAAGRGERGPWQQNESRYDYVDDPAVAVNSRGEMAVAWVEQGRKDILFQRYAADGTKLGARGNISRSAATFSWLPRIVIAPDAPQKIFILWQEIIFSGGSHGGEIFFARSEDGGATFSAPLNLSNSVGGDGKGRINREVWHNGSLDLIAGPKGALYAAWTEYDGPLWFSRSTDGGNSFSRPQRIAGDSARPARAPSLALKPHHTVYLAWTIGEDRDADIHVATSTDGGATFNAPHLVASGKGYADAPRLAVDPGGALHLVYSESAGGPFERSDIRYTRSVDGARTFDPPRIISAPAPPSVTSAGFPALSVDAQGRLYVLWELFQNHREPPRGLGMAVSCDAGNRFTLPALVPGSSDPAGGVNGSQQGLLMKKLAVNDAGFLSIVNAALKQDEHSRVWLVRSEASRTCAGS